ncbi:MAG: DNA primase [Candidatus Woykebacteria bacterium GWB1_45_5]|uniref:DNA primase n=1 Tax=Candidatus Woykebacteria bacterium GWB1_45_5 TaxID=1802592 RepID=A0A1G1W3Q9_9BACT|nr:MAG: DNA primase [Candidatus Woykebacteria bacterium GWB1_45_5]
MESQVDEVKSRVDIVGLISEYIPLKKAGRNYKALCPFHGEKTPSFMVSPDRQIFKCFGCSEGGDAFAFLKRMEGMEFGEALRFLAARAGVRLKEYKPSPAEEKKETLLKISELTSDLYHYLLTKHTCGEPARSYLKSRGITSKSIKDFKLGFASPQKNFLFRFLAKKGFSPQDISLAGLTLTTNEGIVDRFKNRIIFPIFDTQGRTIAFSCRSLGDDEPKYLNSPETPLFHKSKALYGINLAKTAIKKEKSAILVEGNIDVISAHQVGTINAVAPLGTAVTGEQVEILRRFAENLLFAFDTDLAGDAAAKRGIEIAENVGLNIRVVELGEDKDPDELIQKKPLEWKRSIKEAVPIYDYFINSALKRFGPSGAESKRKVAAEVLPQLARLTDEIIKAHYLQVLESKLGIEEGILRAALNKYQGEGKETRDIAEILEKPLSERKASIVEKYLLALIVQSSHPPKALEEKIFEQTETREIFRKIVEFTKKQGRLKIKSLAKTIPESLLPAFDEILLLEIDEEILADGERVEKEINYCAQRLEELNLRTKLRQLSLAIKQAESTGDEAKITTLSREFRDLSKALLRPETS